MTTEPTSSSGNPEHQETVFAGGDAATAALAEASEALNDLRDIAARVGKTAPHARQNDAIAADETTIKINAEATSEAGDEAEMEIENSSTQPETVAAQLEAAEERPPAEKLISEILQGKQAEEAQPHAKQKVGDVLRDARVAAELALEDIAAEIKIRPHHLEAIEEGRFGDLPSRTYAVGFVRAYAQVLRLDAEKLVQDCRREVAQHMPYKAPQMAMPEPTHDTQMPGSSLVFLTAALAFLLSAAGYVFTRDTAQAPIASPPIPEITAAREATPEKKPPVQAPQRSAPSQQNQNALQQPPQEIPPQAQGQNAPQPAQAQIPQPPNAVLLNGAAPSNSAQELPKVPVPHEEPANVDTADVDTTHVSSGFLQKGLVMPGQPAAPGKTATSPSRIKLRAVQETTVQIFDASGRMIAERVINKGEAFYVPDKSGYTLATTNAGALHMQIDGREMQPLGDPDEAMHNIPLNPDSLLKYLQ